MTTKLTPRTPEQCALIDERSRQAKTGELDAGYWDWFALVSNHMSNWTHYNPAPSHPHYAKYCEWQSLVDSGEVAKGWWKIYQTTYHSYDETLKPNWLPDTHYEIQKTDKHPENCKPALKLIDWSKMPTGAMTNKGRLIGHSSEIVLVLVEETKNAFPYATRFLYADVRLAQQTKWAYWGGGDCPVPDGLVVEAIFRDDKNSVLKFPDQLEWEHYKVSSDIIAYRIIGLADGWTDDPRKAA